MKKAIYTSWDKFLDLMEKIKAHVVIPVLAIIIVFLVNSCYQPKPTPVGDHEATNVNQIPFDGKVHVLYESDKYKILGRVYVIENAYSSHVIWGEDTQGHLISIATH